ncbi:hypothetical protein D9613_004334 [Agrocybe pediades]|uniref:Uncharacterized protein n=1 Tax=Agrocybe pediades TaxID=84607 RepID=A0A8H4QIL6_9AGAR|nr:hypothetical protein D9613_004334 [Agrocybe pediades]
MPMHGVGLSAPGGETINDHCSSASGNFGKRSCPNYNSWQCLFNLKLQASVATILPSCTMLNPPLSILPYEILLYIVDCLAALSSADRDLRALSLADRIFTSACQKWIFKTFRLYGGGKATVDDQLQTKGKILAQVPLLSHRIRKLQLQDINNQLSWLLSEPRFVSILQMLALSPIPPNELILEGSWYKPVVFSDIHFFTTRLSQSFFPGTLTTLRLWECRDVPLKIITMLPRLKNLYLDAIEAGKEDCLEYGDELLGSKHIPAIEVLESRQSHTMLASMTAPSLTTGEYILQWDKLRILRLPPQDNKGMQYLPLILSLSYESLEELYLDDLDAKSCVNLPLAELVDLSNLSELRIFTLRFDLGTYGDLTEVNTVLQRIPSDNKLTNITIEFPVKTASTLCFNERWRRLCDEVKRASAQRRLEFELQFYPSSRTTSADEVNEQVKKLQENLSSFMKSESTVCLHVWSPICWTLGIAPMISGTYLIPHFWGKTRPSARGTRAIYPHYTMSTSVLDDGLHITCAIATFTPHNISMFDCISFA